MVDRGCLQFNKSMAFLDTSILNRAPVTCIRNLAPGFAPCDMDVLCSRGSESYNHPGNRKLRQLIQENLPKYIDAVSKMDKSLIVSTIVETIREQSSTKYGFVRKVNGQWQTVTDKLAREKVGQGFRAAMKRGPPSKSEQAIEKCQQQQTRKSTALAMSCQSSLPVPSLPQHSYCSLSEATKTTQLLLQQPFTSQQIRQVSGDVGPLANFSALQTELFAQTQTDPCTFFKATSTMKRRVSFGQLELDAALALEPISLDDESDATVIETLDLIDFISGLDVGGSSNNVADEASLSTFVW